MLLSKLRDILKDKSLPTALFIFLLAALPRLTSLNLIEYKYDEALFVFQIKQFYSNPHIISVGSIASTGVQNYPLFNYIIVFLGLISQHPLYLSFVIALVNSFAVAVFYLVTKTFFKNWIAFFSALFLAVSPWNILFSRKIWQPDILIWFIVPYIYFFAQLFKRNNPKDCLFLFLILGLLMQIHASGLFLLISTVLVIFILKVNVSLKYSSYGFLLSLIPAIPFFLFQITSLEFCPDCSRLIDYMSVPKNFDWINLVRIFSFLGGFSYQIVLGKDYLEFINNSLILKISQWLLVIPFLLLVSAVSLAVVKKNNNLISIQKNIETGLLLNLVFVPIFYLLTKTPSYPHYFVILSPVLFLVFTLVVYYLWVNLKKTRIIVLISLTAIILENIFFNFLFIDYVANKKVIKGDYGPVFEETERKVEQSLKNYKSSPFYDELKYYSYVFAWDPSRYEWSNILDFKIGEYLLQKDDLNLAEESFFKAAKNPDISIPAKLNLTYVYIQKGELEKAEKNIKELKLKDATGAAVLEQLLNTAKQYGR